MVLDHPHMSFLRDGVLSTATVPLPILSQRHNQIMEHGDGEQIIALRLLSAHVELTETFILHLLSAQL